MTEVEVKIRLANAQVYQQFQESLKAPPFAEEDQENVFFDTVDGRLGAERVVLRLRTMHNHRPPKHVLTVKEKGRLVDGISQVGEQEAVLPADVAQAILTDPNTIQHASTPPLLTEVVQRFHANDVMWHRIGSFRNLRRKYHWHEYTLEVDHTKFPFGDAWEIELETPDALNAKRRLEAHLKAHHVPYAFSQRNKFVNMLKGSIL